MRRLKAKPFKCEQEMVSGWQRCKEQCALCADMQLVRAAMVRAKDGAITPQVPTRKQFSDALQRLIDSHDGESVSVEHAERLALYLDAIYAKLAESPDAS